MEPNLVSISTRAGSPEVMPCLALSDSHPLADISKMDRDATNKLAKVVEPRRRICSFFIIFEV